MKIIIFNINTNEHWMWKLWFIKESKCMAVDDVYNFWLYWINKNIQYNIGQT